MFYAGDDEEANRVVTALIEDSGFDPVYVGSLADAAPMEASRRRLRRGVPWGRGPRVHRVVFALHRSVDDPNEFRIYETWESEELVGAHEANAPFLEYRERLRPLVEGDSVVWGNPAPFAIKGYEA